MKFKSNIGRLAVLVGLVAIIPEAVWSQGNACDLNNDGTVNVVDVQLSINMALDLLPCTANVVGAGVCNVVVVQRVINTALGGTCTASNVHSTALAWSASTSSNVAGYNVYRGVKAGGPYVKLNSSLVVGISYSDGTVLAGQTYYYVTTAVDSTNESAYSNEAQAVVPSP
jgi:hypothetical protein